MIEIDPHRLLTTGLVTSSAHAILYYDNMRYNVCSLAAVTVHDKRFFPQHSFAIYRVHYYYYYHRYTITPAV